MDPRSILGGLRGSSATVATLQELLSQKRAQAATSWAELDGIKTEMKKKGVDLLTDRVSFDRLDSAGKRYDGLAEECKNLEQKWAKAVVSHQGGAPAAPSAWYKDFRRQVDEKGIDFKAFTAGGWTLPPAYDPEVTPDPGRRIRFVRAIIANEPLDGTDRFSYARQTVRSNQAGPVAAGAVKPTSVYTITRQEDRVRVIAHISEPIDRSLLVDESSLVSFIEDEMQLGLLLAEDAQILNGSGIEENMTGILNTVGILSQARGTDTRADAVHKGITALRRTEIEPNAIVVHPNDWEEATLERDSNGQYYGGGPFVGTYGQGDTVNDAGGQPYWCYRPHCLHILRQNCVNTGRQLCLGILG